MRWLLRPRFGSGQRPAAYTNSSTTRRSSSRYIGRPLWSGIVVAGSTSNAWYKANGYVDWEAVIGGDE